MSVAAIFCASFTLLATPPPAELSNNDNLTGTNSTALLNIVFVVKDC